MPTRKNKSKSAAAAVKLAAGDPVVLRDGSEHAGACGLVVWTGPGPRREALADVEFVEADGEKSVGCYAVADLRRLPDEGPERDWAERARAGDRSLNAALPNGYFDGMEEDPDFTDFAAPAPEPK